MLLLLPLRPPLPQLHCLSFSRILCKNRFGTLWTEFLAFCFFGPLVECAGFLALFLVANLKSASEPVVRSLTVRVRALDYFNEFLAHFGFCSV